MSQTTPSSSTDDSAERPTPPEPLQADHVTAQLIRDRIWRPAKLENDWRAFAIVGREGSGKSLTCASILSAVDPSFGVENIHFDPVPFLEDIGDDPDRPGLAVMSDETGVGFGNRTWHDREQVEANQALQTARDWNRVVGLTAPRLEEIDSQLRGRLHMIIETVGKRDGEWVEVKVKHLRPTRTGQGKMLTPFPRKSVDNRVRKITRLKIGPPPDSLIEAYEEKKRAWKEDLFDRVIDRYEDERTDEPDDRTPRELSEEILDDDALESFIGDNHGQKYIDRSKIAATYGIGDSRAKKVKALLQDEVDADVM